MARSPFSSLGARPVGGPVTNVLRVARPPDDSWRAYATLAPKAVLLAWARSRRRRFPDALPVGVTGSVGKTTTKTLLAAALATAGPVAVARGNRASGVLRTLRTLRPETRYLVQEVGANGPGSLDELLWTLEPRAAVVTAVRPEHIVLFGDVEAVEREKRKLVDVLPADGLAVLNADDPAVRRMADRHPGRVVLAGAAADADVRLLDASTGTDGRCRVVVALDGRDRTIETRLVGRHWAASVVQALAAAVALGAEADAAAAAVAASDPYPERLTPLELPSGALMLVDTIKLTPTTLPPALDVLADVGAQRRIAVVGAPRYFDGTPVEAVVAVAHAARAVADEVWLYGAEAHEAATALADEVGGTVTPVASVREVAERVRDGTRTGDLVLLKGTYFADHLLRVALQFDHDVRCWRDDCAKRLSCSRCPALVGGRG